MRLLRPPMSRTPTTPAPNAPPDMDMNMDPSLVQRVAVRDEAALRDVYRRHHASLRQFARRLLSDRAAADDLVHEVFVRLPRAIRRLPPDAPLGPRPPRGCKHRLAWLLELKHPGGAVKDQ